MYINLAFKFYSTYMKNDTVLYISKGAVHYFWADTLGATYFWQLGQITNEIHFFLGIGQARILKYPNRNEIVLCFTNLFHIVSIVYHTYASSLLKLYECWYFHEIREGTVTSWGRSFLGGAFFHLSTGGTFMACQGDLVFFNHLGSGTGFFITFLLLKIV